MEIPFNEEVIIYLAFASDKGVEFTVNVKFFKKVQFHPGIEEMKLSPEHSPDVKIIEQNVEIAPKCKAVVVRNKHL